MKADLNLILRLQTRSKPTHVVVEFFASTVTPDVGCITREFGKWALNRRSPRVA
jgi:hypothetical protein